MDYFAYGDGVKGTSGNKKDKGKNNSRKGLAKPIFFR